MDPVHEIEPILFCIYRGFENTKKSFETIRIVKPKKLYLASDGPFSKDQKIEVLNIREWVLTNIDWDCSTKTFFREENQGIKKAITQAIDWVTSQEDYFFVIECDCCIHPLFVKIAPLLKDRLEMMGLKNYNICSYSLRTKNYKNLLFQRATLVMIWGWYVKSSTWRKFNVETLPKLSSIKLFIFFIRYKLGLKTAIFWLAKLFDCFCNIDKTWGNRYAIHCMINDIPSFIPNRVLCDNIGIGNDFATNATSLYSVFSNSKFNIEEKIAYEDSNLIDNSTNTDNDKFFGVELFKIYSNPKIILIKALLVLFLGNRSIIIYKLTKILYKFSLKIFYKFNC